jgi:hypothetical protein
MRAVSYPVLALPAAIKSSTATSTSGQTYPISGATMVPARTISVTTTAMAAAYAIVSPIVITGTDAADRPLVESLSLTQTGGGETIVGLQGFKTVTSIAVPAQALATGAFTFGVRDVVCATPPVAIRVGTAGSIKLGYADGTVDTIAAAAAGETFRINPIEVFGDASTTATNLTLLFT